MALHSLLWTVAPRYDRGYGGRWRERKREKLRKVI